MTLWFLGDSTAANKTTQERPQTGWIEQLDYYLKPELKIVNLAKNGASTRSFLNSQRYLQFEEQVQKDDFVLIQFGHNDQKASDKTLYSDPWGDYQRHILNLIALSHERQAKPMILTATTRRIFNANNQITDTFGDYLTVLHQIAAVQRIPLIDINTLTKVAITKLGPERSKEMYLYAAPGEYVNYPDGVTDDTHFSQKGANLVAQLFVTALQQSSYTLKDYLWNV